MITAATIIATAAMITAAMSVPTGRNSTLIVESGVAVGVGTGVSVEAGVPVAVGDGVPVGGPTAGVPGGVTVGVGVTVCVGVGVGDDGVGGDEVGPWKMSVP